MQQFKNFIKKILLKVPFVNFIFIYLNYKIFNTIIKIHDHTSHNMIMTKRNFAIYDARNAGKVTGVDNQMNYEYAFSKKIIEICNKNKIFLILGLPMVIMLGLRVYFVRKFTVLKATI